MSSPGVHRRCWRLGSVSLCMLLLVDLLLLYSTNSFHYSRFTTSYVYHLTNGGSSSHMDLRMLKDNPINNWSSTFNNKKKEIKSTTVTTMPSSSSSNTVHKSIKQAQVLEFMDPATNTKIVLVGSMHYNPVSVQLAKDVVRSYAITKQLQAVIVESCPLRWKNHLNYNFTYDLDGQRVNKDLYFTDLDHKKDDSTTLLQNIVKQLLYNEMIAGKEMAMEYQIPVILGDQLINVTNSRIGQNFKTTLQDIISPLTGGWKRLVQDITTSVMLALPTGEEYLGTNDFFDGKLLTALPVTLVKYPLALMLKSPITIIPILLLLSATIFQQSSTATTSTTSIVEYPWDIWTNSNDLQMMILTQIQDYAVSILVFVTELVLFSRVFLIAILQERNEIIAKSILVQCKQRNGKNSMKTNNKIGTKGRIEAVTNNYNNNNNNNVWMKTNEFFKSSLRKLWEKISDDIEDEEELKIQKVQIGQPKVVVAILGMAHCNGIKKLIEEKRITL